MLGMSRKAMAMAMAAKRLGFLFSLLVVLAGCEDEAPEPFDGCGTTHVYIDGGCQDAGGE